MVDLIFLNELEEVFKIDGIEIMDFEEGDVCVLWFEMIVIVSRGLIVDDR